MSKKSLYDYNIYIGTLVDGIIVDTQSCDDITVEVYKQLLLDEVKNDENFDNMEYIEEKISELTEVTDVYLFYHDWLEVTDAYNYTHICDNEAWIIKNNNSCIDMVDFESFMNYANEMYLTINDTKISIYFDDDFIYIQNLDLEFLDFCFDDEYLIKLTYTILNNSDDVKIRLLDNMLKELDIIEYEQIDNGFISIDGFHNTEFIRKESDIKDNMISVYLTGTNVCTKAFYCYKAVTKPENFVN